MKRILLVDTLNSCFYLKHSKESNVVWKFIEDIREIAARFQVDQVIFAYEGVGGSRYRKELYPEYKWKRKELREKATPVEKKEFDTFIKQVDLLIKMAPMFGIKTINVDNAEADDTIAYLINNIDTEKYQILLLSTDSDLHQLLRPNVVQGSYGKDLCNSIGLGNISGKTFKNHKQVFEESGLTPMQYAEAKSLSGDTSDSIRGFDKVGEKIAARLIQKYGSLQEVEENLDSLDVPRLIQRSKDHLKSDFNLSRFNFQLINLNWSREKYIEILGENGVRKLDMFIDCLDDKCPIDDRAVRELCFESGRIDIVDKLDFWLSAFRRS